MKLIAVCLVFELHFKNCLGFSFWIIILKGVSSSQFTYIFSNSLCCSFCYFSQWYYTFKDCVKLKFFNRKDFYWPAGNLLQNEVAEPLLEIILWHRLTKGVPKFAASLNVCAYVHIIMSNTYICMYFWPIDMTGKLCIPQSWLEYS